MANLLGRLRKSGGAWLWDWAIEHWTPLLVVGGGALMTYFAVVTQALAPYGLLAWGAVGIAAIAVLALIVFLLSVAKKIRVKAEFDELQLEKGSLINPLDATFERKRILLNDFALPSYPLIDGKTFIDCEIVGPGCTYLQAGNQITESKAPRIDAVWLAPRVKFWSGFTFTNCIFRRCSFQRVTLFAGLENYHPAWADNPFANWIGIPPTAAQIADRRAEQAEVAAAAAPRPAAIAGVEAAAPGNVAEGKQGDA